MGYRTFKKKRDAIADLKESWDLLNSNFDKFKEQYETFEVIRVGRFLEGKGFYHEVDEEYTCVGFEVELDIRFDMGDGTLSDMSREIGFYSVWMGRSHAMAPFSFGESYQALGESHHYANGLGDYFNVTRVLASIEDVNRVVFPEHSART